MARPRLHKFKDDLKNKPGDGSDAPPRTLRARDLDGNFRKVTVLDGEGSPPAYRVKPTDDGLILTDLQGLPDGAMAKQFTICENGEPVQYWFLVWQNKPDLG